VIPLEMSVDQAMRFIFTLGVVSPDWPPAAMPTITPLPPVPPAL
jgi:uncharacterized membrane protein